MWKKSTSYILIEYSSYAFFLTTIYCEVRINWRTYSVFPWCMTHALCRHPHGPFWGPVYTVYTPTQVAAHPKGPPTEILWGAVKKIYMRTRAKIVKKVQCFYRENLYVHGSLCAFSDNFGHICSWIVLNNRRIHAFEDIFIYATKRHGAFRVWLTPYFSNRSHLELKQMMACPLT